MNNCSEQCLRNDGASLDDRCCSIGRLSVSVLPAPPPMPQMLATLLDAGAPINARSACRDSPLLMAAYGGHLAAVRLLLKRGADKEAAAVDGSTRCMQPQWPGTTSAVWRCSRPGLMAWALVMPTA